MHDPIAERVETLRRVELGAALGAAGIVGAALEPFQASFLPQLTDLMVLGSGGDLDRLRVETVIGADAVPEWLDLLRDVYGMNVDNALLAESLGLVLGREHLAVALTEGRASSVPEVGFAFFGRWPSMTVYEALAGVGVGAAPLGQWDGLLGVLASRTVTRVEVAFATPAAPPQFRITMSLSFDDAGRAGFQSRLDQTLELLGVSVGQRRWHGAMVKVFGARSTNPVDLTFALGRQRLASWLGIGWQQVPATLALKILTQFSRDPTLPARLGALAAVGTVGEADTLDRFQLAAWDGEPPRASFELIRRRPELPSL